MQKGGPPYTIFHENVYHFGNLCYKIGKGKNRRFKPCLQEGAAVNGGLGLCIQITLHCNLQLNYWKTTAHVDTKLQTVNIDA